MNNIGIMTFEQHQGRKGVGSSRIRGKWIADKWEGAELFSQGKTYDVVIYQKAYWVEHARSFKGIKIFDLCDPDFLHWAYRTKEMIDEVDAVTTSTEALAESIRKFTDKPVVCIPDRINLDEIKKTKQHNGRAKTVVWYGYSTNFDMLKGVVPALKRLDLDLTVISDTGFNPVGKEIKVRNLPHNWNTVYEDLLDGDIVVNPKGNSGRWKFKSNNKTILAWALGIPVAFDYDDLVKFLDEDARREESVKRLKEVNEQWKVELSVDEYKKLIDDIKQTKTY